MWNNIYDHCPGPEVINESTDNTELVIPVALAEADFKEVILKEEDFCYRKIYNQSVQIATCKR